MPAKSRRKPKIKQARKKPDTKAAKARAKARKQHDKLRAQRDRAIARANAKYRKKLAKLRQTGLYEPVNNRLTKKRKAEINRRYAKFEEFLTGDYYLFVPIPTRSKKKRKAALKLAKKNQLQTTQKGVFVQKTKNTKSAKAIYSKRRKSWRIKVTKVKKGATGKKTVTEIVPIEPLTSLDEELQRIEDDAAELELKRGEALAFKVELGGAEGYSRQIFTDKKLLTNYLQTHYNQAYAARLQFFRAVSVFKTKHESYHEEHPVKQSNPYRGVNRKGRSVGRRELKRSGNYITPFEQGYAAFNSGFLISDNPYKFPPERYQWRNGYLKAQADAQNL